MELIENPYVLGTIYSLIGFILFVASCSILNWLSDAVEEKLNFWCGKKIKDLRIQTVVFLRAEQIVGIFQQLLFILSWIGYFLLFLAWITASLKFFRTQKILRTPFFCR